MVLNHGSLRVRGFVRRIFVQPFPADSASLPPPGTLWRRLVNVLQHPGFWLPCCFPMATQGLRFRANLDIHAVVGLGRMTLGSALVAFSLFTYIYRYTHTYAYMYTCIYVYIYIHIHTCICVYVYPYVIVSRFRYADG